MDDPIPGLKGWSHEDIIEELTTFGKYNYSYNCDFHGKMILYMLNYIEKLEEEWG